MLIRYRITEDRPDHQSATCYVYRAVDEKDEDSDGNFKRVALKLMRLKSQFVREIAVRKFDFNSDHVIDIIRTHPEYNQIENYPEKITFQEEFNENKEIGMTLKMLNKKQAEELFCIVMPAADRNMFVAMKQERFAGKNIPEVRHIFTQLAQCILHMHERGVIHGDIKPLNVMRR